MLAGWIPAMSEHANPWWDDLREDAEALAPPPPPRPPSRLPAVLGATVALLASSGLALWLSRPEPGPSEPAPAVAAPAERLVRTAGLHADLEQVRRAYNEYTADYADNGAAGVARFADSCRQSLAADARILDFCLAFDLFADSASGKPAADPPERLAIVQQALPADASAPQRIAEVRSAMRQVSGVGQPEAQLATAEPDKTEPATVATVATARAISTPRTAPAAHSVRAPEPRPVRRARTADPKPHATTPPLKIPAACRGAPTAADRLVCSDAPLAGLHREMRAAYDAALAAGADQLAVDEGQAEWRVARNAAADRKALEVLYARRIRELKAAARAPHPEEPPR
jgi:hypothetical protein